MARARKAVVKPWPAFIKTFNLDPAPDVIFFMTDGGFLNSLITYRPTVTGNYRIFATTCSSGRTGTFAVTVIDRPL